MTLNHNEMNVAALHLFIFKINLISNPNGDRFTVRLGRFPFGFESGLNSRFLEIFGIIPFTVDDYRVAYVAERINEDLYPDLAGNSALLSLEGIIWFDFFRIFGACSPTSSDMEFLSWIFIFCPDLAQENRTAAQKPISRNLKICIGCS